MPELPEPKVRPHPAHARLAPGFAGGAEAPPSRLRRLSFHQYAELHVTSNFTFLTGASHPDELVAQAAALGYQAIAITDKNSLAGVVRAHLAAKEVGVPLVVGCRLELVAPWEVETSKRQNVQTSKEETDVTQSTDFDVSRLSILVYPTDKSAYARLCNLLTLGKRRAAKGECHLTLHDLLDHHAGLLAVAIPPPILDQNFIDVLKGVKSHVLGDRLSLAMSCAFGSDDRLRMRQIAALAEHVGVPIVATNDVHYHVPARRPLQDVLTCIRHGCTIEQAGYKLFPNAERYLKPPQMMAELFAEYPQALERSVEIAKRASAFSLDELKYQYPDDVAPPGMTAMQYLIDLTWKGAAERYGGMDTLTERVRNQIEHEFRLIEELKYAPYFLTVYDIVKEARARQILCQGRGAAANSAVCYCLGITAVDPDRIDVLFERFVSKERNEPPDIDVDFEHERREEIIQYIYQKYGRDRAGLTAEVITYRGRSAVRDVGKAMGLSLDCVDRMAKNIDWWSSDISKDRWRELGLNPNDPTIRRVLGLTDELLGFPRHLSQHVGGFVITREALCDLVPIENAAMEDRTVIEWDKDDIDAMGMLKVDVLGLGMLTCIRKGLEFVNQRHEGTEARRHEGILHSDELRRGNEHEYANSNVSRFGGMAEGNGFSEDDVSDHESNAFERTVWVDTSDAASRCVSALEYRRVVCPAEHKGLSEASADCKGFSCGISDTARIEHSIGNAQSQSDCQRPVGGNGSGIAGIDSEHRGEDKELGTESGKRFNARKNLVAASIWDANGNAEAPSPPSCLRASVPSCLSKSSVASSLAPSFPLQLHTIPPEDPAVYDMICAADTIGVFQIESRAQMSMLPRLRPRCFYDLVIEVAIVRPGPIQGDMVHPYLRRRNGQEQITYPDERVEKVLKKTLGVPLFQEQAMSLAIVAAGFTPGEADQLRRAIAAWKTKGNQIAVFGEKLMSGMIANGYDPKFAERCFEQVKGFSGYGFPESHAASFALLVYVSAWLKCHYPAAFAAALLNSQPMGFYAPAQIVRDAREHDVTVLPIDVNRSMWDCTLENQELNHREHRGHRESEKKLVESSLRPQCSPCLIALRLGMRLIRGLSEVDAKAISDAVKKAGPFHSIDVLHRASGVRISVLRRLAAADAFGSMGLDRQHALWQVRALRDEKLPMFDERHAGMKARRHEGETGAESDEATPPELRRSDEGKNHFVPSCLRASVPVLPPVSEFRKVAHDCAATGLSLRAHPISFIRDRLNTKRVTPNGELKDESRWNHGKTIAVAGLVLVRQRPSTANGIVFMTLEDETGIANLIIRPNIYRAYRKAAKHGIVVLARGRVERQGEVVHILVRQLEEITLADSKDLARSRDFH
jgi:error-prone DNA polymerase